MAVTLGEFAFGIIINLVSDAIERIVDISGLDFFEQRRIKTQVENAVAEIVKPLIPFLKQEKIDEDKQQRLLQTCVDELMPYSQNPELLFHGSINGQKIFEELYNKKQLPQVVIEDGTKEVYILLFPRIAEILCRIPSSIKEWESLAWKEDFRRLDEIVQELRRLFIQVDELQHKPEIHNDETLKRIRRALVQKIGLEMDITGLRGDQPISGKLNDFFVHPIIQEISADKNKKIKVVTNPTEAVSQFTKPNQNTIIIGVAGAGKSTWTKWFQREYLTRDGKGLAIRVELRECKKNSLPSIQQLVREAPGKHYAEEITTEMISSWLKQKLLIFIFDGFDEVISTERDEVYGWIVDLSNAAMGCPIILTSRPLTTDHLDRKEIANVNWSIEPFDKPRIIEYITNWYGHISLLSDVDRNINAEKISEEWFHDPTLAPLTTNPLLLSTLLMVHHLDGHLPNGRALLYKRYIDGMLGIWDDRRNLQSASIAISYTDKRTIIRGLALHMFLNEKDQIEEGEILDWLTSFLLGIGCNYSAIEILCLLRERTGLIIGPGVYSFAHNTIAEYLVAESVWEGDQKDITGKTIDRMYLFEKRDIDHWNIVIFLWAGLSSIADLITFIESCLAVNNFELAYGILFDQFQRINDKDTRRKLLLINSNSLTKVKNNDRHIIIFGLIGSPSSINIACKLSSFQLRGVLHRTFYSDLISLALNNNTLTFSDRLVAKPQELIHHIWLLSFSYISYENNIELQEYISNPNPLFKSLEEWNIYALFRILTEYEYSNKISIRKIVNLCNELFFDYINLIPLLLLSSIYNFTQHAYRRYSDEHEINENDSDRIIRCIELLQQFREVNVNNFWLTETISWSTEFPIHLEKFDLLKSAKKGLQRISSDFQEQKYFDTIRYIDSLIAQRKRLIKNINV